MAKITIELERWQIGAKLERQIREDYTGITHGKSVTIDGLPDKILVVITDPPAVGRDPRD